MDFQLFKQITIQEISEKKIKKIHNVKVSSYIMKDDDIVMMLLKKIHGEEYVSDYIRDFRDGTFLDICPGIVRESRLLIKLKV